MDLFFFFFFQAEDGIRDLTVTGVQTCALPISKVGGEGDFGEILRHEVNNPLTGILGNAELLLAELRRRKDNSMPPTAQQRLQTIADLAVRLRETIRRLSDDLQKRDLHARML